MAEQAGINILMIATEAAPFAKEGGVADVLGSLPKALAALGHDVRVAIPRYGTIDRAQWELAETGVARSLWMCGGQQEFRILRSALPASPVTIYFFEHDGFFGWHRRLYFGQDVRDEQRRFLLFCRGLLEVLPALDFAPDIIHLHDWQAAPAAAYLRTSYRHLLRAGRTRILYTIHNLQYQGRWDPSILDEAGLDRARVFVHDGLEYWGDVSWAKAGINYSDIVTTVSRRYAEEIQTLDLGWGLDEVLFQRHTRLFGIANGIDWDEWNPATDEAIEARYTAEDAGPAKQRNRTVLRREFGLEEDSESPVVGIVSRLVDQKGFDLVAELAEELGRLPLQLVVLGAGHPGYEELFRSLSARTQNVRARIGFDVALSHRIYAGSDLFLMPSAFEPGGLGQLIAMRYGTVPIVRATGGLADTVTDATASPKVGTGYSFTEHTAPALLDALRRALRAYNDPKRWPALVARAMAYDSRWSARARAYADLYARALRLPPA
jgi:starch synthase